MRPRALISWSSGKDSAYALNEIRRAGELDVIGLLTTVTTAYGRVSMHGVREELLEQQAQATGLALFRVGIPAPCPNAVYEQELLSRLSAARDDGVTHVVFGDLFLADIRAYREQLLARVGLQCVFPLWKRETGALAREMIAAGLRATLTCVDLAQLDVGFAGRELDAALLADLPSHVDPCGENGEFHTFVTAGPMFDRTISVRAGEVVQREGFAFADLAPNG